MKCPLPALNVGPNWRLIRDESKAIQTLDIPPLGGKLEMRKAKKMSRKDVLFGFRNSRIRNLEYLLEMQYCRLRYVNWIGDGKPHHCVFLDVINTKGQVQVVAVREFKTKIAALNFSASRSWLDNIRRVKQR